MQPTILIDTANINIYSIPFSARPGQSFPYDIRYSNVGTTTISPLITINYNNQLLTYDSSSNPAVINNGNSLSLSETNFVPGQASNFVAYFTIKTTDTLKSVINTSATIKANLAIASDSTFNFVISSYDPNGKQATPILTPQQVAEGKSINYTIHFQNTGDDTAFNIVIADTLSSLLQDSTLQMINSSSPCKVTVTGNVVFFEFLNVLLPDSGVNSIGSNGYVSFSVKPAPSVTTGSAINNTASIYFDYNSPVITNTASTLIQNPNSVVPVTLLSFTALTQPGNTNTLLYWTTANEINTKSFIVEQSTDGTNFTDIATVAAKGSGGHSYSYSVTENLIVYYRLKMVDIDGQYAYSTVIEVGNNQNNESFIVITNPAKNLINIKTTALSLTNTSAEIINSEGAVVRNFTLQQGLQTIDVSELAEGFYYIKTNLVTRKVVISR